MSSDGPESRSGRDPVDLTGLLLDLRRGAAGASEALLLRLHESLKSIARQCLAGGPPRASLQPTDLVHEAWLRLFDHARVDWSDRSHFFRLAAKVMRDLLVDHARRARALKRGGGRRPATLDEAIADDAGLGEEILAVHEALDELTGLDARQAEIVALRYFSGLSIADAATALGLSTATVEREWRSARAWLGSRLRD